MRFPANISWCPTRCACNTDVEFEIVGHRLAVHEDNAGRCTLFQLSLFDFAMRHDNDEELYITFKEKLNKPLCAFRCRIEPPVLKSFLARLQCERASVLCDIPLVSSPHCMMCESQLPCVSPRNLRTYFWHVCALLVFTVIEVWLQGFQFASVSVPCLKHRA